MLAQHPAQPIRHEADGLAPGRLLPRIIGCSSRPSSPSVSPSAEPLTQSLP